MISLSLSLSLLFSSDLLLISFWTKLASLLWSAWMRLSSSSCSLASLCFSSAICASRCLRAAVTPVSLSASAVFSATAARIFSASASLLVNLSVRFATCSEMPEEAETSSFNASRRALAAAFSAFSFSSLSWPSLNLTISNLSAPLSFLISSLSPPLAFVRAVSFSPITFSFSPAASRSLTWSSSCLWPLATKSSVALIFASNPSTTSLSLAISACAEEALFPPSSALACSFFTSCK
mmetsp:Transcript_14332/g.26382  ORF Transcript_14332/g.26382 Transcript_14332/m.26382 type:complete len:237 (+) Transcript_14332:1693-2403(+)